MNASSTTPTGALAGIKVLDLSRVLAGPWATQMLADLGADVVKVERPVAGDDTRHWGPPFLKDDRGNDTREASYFTACNRNKRSLTVDMAHPEGLPGVAWIKLDKEREWPAKLELRTGDASAS